MASDHSMYVKSTVMHSSSGGDTDATKMQLRADDKHISSESLNKSTAILSVSFVTSTLVTTSVTRTRGDRGLAHIGRLGTPRSTTVKGTDDILAGFPVNIRAVVFGSSAAFLLLVLGIVVLSSRRRCRSALSHESPSVGGSFGCPTTAITPPARLLSYVNSQPTLSPLDLKHSTFESSMSSAQPALRRKHMLWSVDENGQVYASKYDSSNRPQKTANQLDDNSSAFELGGATDAPNGRHQRRNVHKHNRTRQPPAPQGGAMTSVVLVHRNPAGDSEFVSPLRHSMKSSSTASINIDCQDSLGTALDSGVSGMDVSTSVTQDDITEDEFGSSVLPVYISVMVASTTPTDESIVSSMSISEEESNGDEDDNASSLSPVPTLLYEKELNNSGVELPSNSDTRLELVTTNMSANGSDDLIFSSVRARRHHNNDAGEDYGTSEDSKRPRLTERGTIRLPGSPHPRKAVLQASLQSRCVQSRSVVYRRRYSGDPDVSSKESSRRQQLSANETDATVTCCVVESRDGGSKKLHVEHFDTAHAYSEIEDECEAVIRNRSKSGMSGMRCPTEVTSTHAVRETSQGEICLKPSLSSSHFSSSPQSAVIPVVVDSSSGSHQFATTVSLTSDHTDSGHCHQTCCNNHNEDGNVDSHANRRSFDHGGSATFLSSTAINSKEVSQQNSRPDSADQRRRRQLGRLLQREDVAAVNADVLEHIYDEYGGIERIGAFARGEDTDRSSSTGTREVTWEMQTVF